MLSTRKRYIIFLAFIALYCLVPQQAQAQLFVDDINFDGNHTFSGGTIRQVIETREKALVPKILFWTKAPRFDEAVLQDDIRRIVAFYQSEGFLYVQVTETHQTRENKVKITFHIQENKPVNIAEIQYKITPENSYLPDFDQQNPVPSLDLEQGSRFTDLKFITDKQKMTDYFADSGYPYSKIDHTLALRNDSLLITYLISSGPHCYFGDITINKTFIPEKSLKKQYTLATGDYFSQKELQETQQRLYNLGVFQYVAVNALLDSIDEDHNIPITLQFKESPRFKSQVGFGYGKEDRFRVSAKITRLGFLGGVRKLTLAARHSYLEPYNINLTWLHPAFIYSGTTLSLEPFLRKEREPGYELGRYGLGVNFYHKLSKYSNTFFRYSLEKDNLDLNSVTLEDLEEQTVRSIYNKSSVTLGMIRDSSSPILVPETGSYISMTYTLSGLNFNSAYHYQRFLLEMRYYYRLFDSVIIALKSKWGAVSPWKGGEHVPIEERFFAGGYTSIRGWGRSRLGPAGSNGQPVGGNSLTENSIELRIPFIPPVSAVMFLDFGNVWSTNLSYPVDKWRCSPGIGFWLQTPIGPLRGDIAVPMPFELNNTQFYINVGHAF